MNKVNQQFSIIIPAKNEALNLPVCLDSVRDFDDVLLVDSGSTDATCEIAKEYGREVVQFEWNGRFPKKRNWILQNYQFKHDWVLFLDADERITEEFIREAEEKLATTAHSAFIVRYDNWFMTRLLKHGDPMRKTALLKIGWGEYEQIAEDRWSSLDMEIHEHMVVEGSVGALDARLEHHDKRCLSSYYNKHNDYSSWEARRALALTDKRSLTKRQRIKYSLITAPFFPVLYFISSYFFKLGFLDGKAGFLFAINKMFYFYQIQSKIIELKSSAQ